jgi:hypothetical protein
MGRLRWLCRLPLGLCWHATVSTVPRVQGQGRPPGAVALRQPGRAEAATSARDQIAKASSSNATATRRFTGSSTASS